MVILLGKLNMEKQILNKIIEDNDMVLSNNFILEQSRIVDKLIIAYNIKKMECNDVYNEFKYRNVGKYEGQRKNGRIEGTGTYYYGNGDKYIGQWRNDLMEGYGIYYHYASGSKYDGQWGNGLQEGIGTFYNSRGLKYIGKWLKGRCKIPYFNKKQQMS